MSRTPRHIIIVAHPDPDSFNVAIAHGYAQAVREQGQEAMIRDLYALDFDPVLRNQERPGRADFALGADVEAELAIIGGGDVYVFVYPLWFGMPPAILTGYVERVLGAGVTATAVQARAGQGVLHGRRLLSIITSGAREIWLDEQGQIESLRNLMARYLFHAFAMRSADHLQIGGIVEGTPADFIEQHLREVRERAIRMCAQLREQES